ncbi:MAG: BrnT family toxin [Chitinophagales bacterium]|nr:BrnT family toxin [Chitinophagales bacterium]
MKFQWDEGNIEKSWKKHGVPVGETESIWLDNDRKIFLSRINTDNELRFACIGMSNENRLLSVIFTFRNENFIRPISARPSNKKEKKVYYGF